MDVLPPVDSLDFLNRRARIEEHFGTSVFYLTCRHFYEGDDIARIEIDEDCPVVIRNEKMREKFNLSATYRTRHEAHIDKRHQPMLAVGAALWVHTAQGWQTALFKKNKPATHVQNWHHISGICSGDPLQAMNKKLATNCVVADIDEQGRVELVQFIYNGEKNLDRTHIDSQLQAYATPMEIARAEVTKIPLGDIEDKNGHTLTLAIGGADAVKFKVPHVCFDARANAVVLTRVFTLEAHGATIKLLDAKRHKRQGALFDLDTALGQRLESHTRSYLETCHPTVW